MPEFVNGFLIAITLRAVVISPPMRAMLENSRIILNFGKAKFNRALLIPTGFRTDGGAVAVRASDVVVAGGMHFYNNSAYNGNGGKAMLLYLSDELLMVG